MSVSSIKPRPRLRSLSCPRCGKKAVLQRILYGLPSEEFDHDRYISGGCVVSDDSPEIACVKCGWAGFRDPMTGEVVDVEERELWEK